MARFTCADVALLRAAAQPLGPSGKNPATDEELLEAVGNASPSLARDLRKLARGEPVKDRVLLALTKYHLRMTHRPTPFGFFAGVAPVRIGGRPSMRVGAAHRPVSRPDAAWLHAVLDQVRTEPDVLSRSVLVANNLHTVRNGRLWLLERFDRTGERQLETSIRYTPLVREVLRVTEVPIGWHALADHLRQRFGQGNPFERVLRQLVEIGVLLTDLDPPPDCTDPLGHVLARGGHPLFEELRAIQQELRIADAGTPSVRRERRRAVTSRMRALHDANDLIQTDLRFDAEVTLPAEVAREAERAANVLWRLGSVPSRLDGYREKFLERYGTDRLVPVIELLDETIGIGPPEAVEPKLETRERLLSEQLLLAVRERRTELVLDDDLVDALAVHSERFPASMELSAEVLADSWESLCAGEFRLVVGESMGSALAGTTVARFAHLLPELDQELTRLARAGAPADAAQVACRPKVLRSANVSSVPQRFPSRIPLGCGPTTTAATDIPLARLAVGATLDRLFLVDTATGARVVPVSGSMLNPRSGHIPPVARFLLELGEQDLPRCRPWTWGPLAAAPFLPRVRFGRSVLSPARWLPSPEMRQADDWEEHVRTWRARWDVPREVQLVTADNRIPVDLDDPLHLRLFGHELRKVPHLIVQEAPPRGGWLRGPRGPHACEVVFQLLGEPAPPQRIPLTPQRSADLLQFPGGEWLYAKLYAGETAQREILRSRLGELLGDDSDVWFFLRYADPDPHLRFRFHGKREDLWTSLLPRLHDWTAQLRRDGLLARWAVDSYDPEAERYGGPDAISHAERVFHADSKVALALNADESFAALSVLRLGIHFGPASELLDWLSALTTVDERRAVPRDRRVALADRLTPGGQLREATPLDELWTERDEAISAYLSKLDGPQWKIAASLAHMHCNRVFGVDRPRERSVYALLHGALTIRLDRWRHGR